MGCSRKNLLLLPSVAPAAIWVLCSLLFIRSIGANTNLGSRAENFENFKFPSSQLNEEAENNLGHWLDYVHATSDTEDEPWADEYEVDEFGSSVFPQKDKFKPKRTIVVAKDGSGHFTSIQAAIDDIPNVNNERVLIKVKPGIYREKVQIPDKKWYITIEGERPAKDGPGQRSIITYNSKANDLNHTGLPLGTFESATFAVNAKHFIAKHISFKNTAPTPMPGAIGGQAVALRVSADKAAFYGCKFYGRQDTLYDHKGRHFFKNCYVEGTIDFVFGNGRSLYESCHLNALANHGTPGTMTAQKRDTFSLSTGFSFVSSMISGYGTAYLGRAWGNDSRVVFANTYMSKVVIPQGWDNWGIAARDKSVFYAEYNCTGPGANSSERVKWSQQLTYGEAKPFLSIDFINGKKWLQNPIRLEEEERVATAAEAEAAEVEAHAFSDGLMAPSPLPSRKSDSPPAHSQPSNDGSQGVSMTSGAKTRAPGFPFSWNFRH